MRIHTRRNGCNDFPEKAPPVFLPPRPEPGAQDAFPWLLPEIGPSGASGTHGDDVRIVLSSAANPSPRHTPAAAARSAPQSPRTAGGARYSRAALPMNRRHDSFVHFTTFLPSF